MMLNFECLEGVAFVAVDILVYECRDSIEEAKKEHEENLVKLSEVCREQSVKLHRENVRYKSKENKFISHITSDNGIKANSEKKKFKQF